LLEDTADVVGSDLQVSFISPGCTPRVLDKDVFLIIFSSISDSKNTVVKLGSASSAGDNTSSV